MKVSPNASFTEVEDGMIAFQSQTGRFFHLDSMSTRYIKSVQESVPFDEFLEALAREFQVSAVKIRDDFTRLQEQLVENGYLEEPR